MQQITIVLIKNPFNIRDRDAKTVDYSAVKTLAGYLGADSEDVAVSVNGGLVAREEWSTTIPAPGSIIVVCPVVGKSGGKKNILGLIASIALSVVAMGAGSAASGGAWFGKGALQMAGWKFAGYLAAAAVMYLGGTLMNTSSAVNIDSDYTTSQTYSWSTPSTQAQQGIPIPITFGTVRMKSPNVLVAHVTTDGDKQYLNLLLCGGEGPVDSITDVVIDDNPIANFTGVDIQYRYGTNDQDVIPNFADSFADQSLNYKLNSDTYATQQITGNAVQGIELTVEFPQGLFYSNDQGGLDNTNVTIGMEYRAVGAVDWLPFAGGSLSVTAASSSAVRRTARIDNLTAGQYEVRCKILSQSGTTSRYINSCYWTTLSSIVYDDFVYPNLVLVGIKALATDQLSGNTPNVQWTQTRSKVHVWNPTTGAYEEKPATNAAWACYDLIHMARKVYDARTSAWVYVVEGAPAELLIYDDFVRWAAACDARAMVCNYVLDSAGDMDAAWKPFEAAGRGKVVRRGTKYGCIFDQAAGAVQMFSVGNIKAGTFSLDYLPIEDRANSVEITFNNAQKDYERDTLVIYGDGYDTSTDVDNPTQITLDAITDPATIYREGKYYLRKNKHLVRTCNFEADVDAIACQVGDVILVQHDIPQWGFGGRIVSATTTTLTLDREVTLEAGKTYEITVRLADDSIVKRSVWPQVGTTNTLIVATPFPAVPEQYDVYSFGEIEISTKPFTVASITRGADETRKISALEYNEAVYTEATDVPVIDYSKLDFLIDVSSLSLGQETYQQADGVIVSSVYASWTVPRGKAAKAYDVFLSTDGTSFSKHATTKAQSIIISGVKARLTHYVKVFAANESGTYGAGKTESVFVTGKDSLPPDVPTIMVETLYSGAKRLSWSYSYPTINDIAGFRLKYNIGNSRWWQTAIPLHNGLIAASPLETMNLPGGTVTVMVVAVDNAGNESATPAYAIIGLGDVLVDNVLYEADLSAGVWGGTKTGCHVDVDGNLIANDSGDLFYPFDNDAPLYPASDTALFYTANWPEMIYEQSAFVDSAGLLSFAHNIDGNVQIYYRRQYPYAVYGADYEPFYGADDAPLYREGPWSTYAGKVETTPDIHQFRAVVPAGKIQGVIRGLTAVVDVPDKSETLSDVAISASGTQLPITKSYIRIKNVNVTIQDDGATTAVAARCADKDKDGPIIILVDKDNVQVAGTIDATIQGY